MYKVNWVGIDIGRWIFYKFLVRGIDIIFGNYVFDYSNEWGKVLFFYIMR